MNEAHRRVADQIGALLAPVGENWWEYKKSHPTLELYAEDGGHASPAGSDFAAKQIWEPTSPEESIWKRKNRSSSILRKIHR